MVLHTTPYPSAFLSFLSRLSWAFVFPCYWLLDRLLASCVATSLEKRRRSQDPCSFVALGVLITTPLYLVLLLASLPFAFIGFLLWAPLQTVRNPYIYSHQKPDKHGVEQGTSAGTGAALAEWRPQGRSFCFGSANVCLLPDSLARFNNLADTQRRAREVGKRIRNGASRPQIKIYIDSPTNTSISAASFCSLATQGFRRTSSLDHRPEPVVTTETETEALTECPVHPSGGTSSECPVHSSGGQNSSECPLHPNGEEHAPDCAVHQFADPSGDCPVHSTIIQNSEDCPLHPAGVQISITSPDSEPIEDEKGNHQTGDGDTGSLESRTASRESLVRFHAADGGISPNNTLSQHRTSVFKRPNMGRKRRHGDDGFDHEISAFFPANLDFLCLQEVFERRAADRLRRQLHRYFPFVLSDVGRYGWKGCCSRFKFLNSGLLLASRYPILDAHYECFPNGRSEDALAAKGVLFAKIKNEDVLRSVVALLDTSLPDIGPKDMHETVHYPGINTLILSRDHADVLEDYRGRASQKGTSLRPVFCETTVKADCTHKHMLAELYSDSEESPEESSEEITAEETSSSWSWERFCEGLQEFVDGAKDRKERRAVQRGNGKIPPSAVGVESLIVAAACYELKIL
ncbi:sphingomyelin phosphodiesterase 3-like [Garra rufa]|uniref:sphingomyelin phosphodiesterase 3-like n=1 Tax=Garra rufa TaxID=137080 RepID=UPI003CCE835B